VDQAALKALNEYTWPGNIRQLESVIERAVILSDQEAITLSDIKSELRTSQPIGSIDFDLSEEGINFEELEKDLLRKAMAKSHGVVAKAAKLLGMSYKTFWYRWEKLNMENTPSRKQSADE
jgi:transcriptional regulator of acetoin/glycerol metabolism